MSEQRSQSTRRCFLTGTAAGAATFAAGCVGGDDDGNGDSSSGTDGTTGDVSGGGDVEIDFWHIFDGELGDAIEALADDFSEQSDGITVNTATQGGYRENLNQTLQATRAGDPPAVTQIFEIGSRLALDSGAFTPVGEILPEDGVNMDDFLDSVLDYYRFDGQLHSMPFNSSNTIMLYNRDAFEAAGLDSENPPETLSGVTDAAEAIVDAGATDSGITWPNHSWMQIEQQFAQQDQPLVNNENGRAGRPDEAFYASEAGQNVYEWWADLADRDLYLNPGIEAWGEARQAFLTGEVAMLWDSTSNIAPMFEGAAENGFEAGAGFLPTPGGARSGVVIGGASLWVPDALSDEKKAAAGEFLAYMSDTEQQKQWHQDTGYFPVRESSIDELESEGWFEENPEFGVAFDQLQATTDTPATRGAVMGPFAQSRTIVSDTSVEIINGNVGVQEGLEQMDADVETALERYSPEELS